MDHQTNDPGRGRSIAAQKYIEVIAGENGTEERRAEVVGAGRPPTAKRLKVEGHRKPGRERIEAGPTAATRYSSQTENLMRRWRRYCGTPPFAGKIGDVSLLEIW